MMSYHRLYRSTCTAPLQVELSMTYYARACGRRGVNVVVTLRRAFSNAQPTPDNSTVRRLH